MNNINLIGRITKDLELQYTKNNKEYLTFNIAVNRKYKNEKGEYEADFINCSAFGQQANYLYQYAKKGTLIGINGRLETYNYEKNGQTIFGTKVIFNEVTILEKTEKKETFNVQVDTLISDEDLPF